MRKNAPRKWIHAILDVLPILLIPIFAININQKSVEPISIEVQEQISVDFNQQINMYNSTNNFEKISSYEVEVYPSTGIYIQIIPYMELINGNKYYFVTKSSQLGYRYTIQGDIPYIANNVLFEGYSTIITGTGVRSRISITNSTTLTENTSVYANLVNLTQMYGSGNEPTLEEFESRFNPYYDYTLSQKMLVNKPTLTTYDDTDIGSQFLYSLYKPVNDYFNFNNLFNMNDVWQWIQLNLFQGSAPLPVFMIWNIILYEFFIDLIFLLYSVFMFIIDFATNCLEKPFNKER